MVLLILSLQLAPVQNFVRGHVVSYIENRIGTPVSLERIYIKFPNHLEMRNLYVEGQERDTILMVNKLDVGLNIPELLNNKAHLTSIELDGLVSFVTRFEDGRFNYDYIVDAFGTKEDTDDESTPFILELDKINLKNIRIQYDDRVARNLTNISFNLLDVRVKEFNLAENNYALGDFTMDGLRLKLRQDQLEEAAKEVEKTVDSLERQNPFSIDLQRIMLTNFDIGYEDFRSQTFADVQFGELSTRVNQLDLKRSVYDFGELNLRNADIVAKLHLPATESGSTSEGSTSGSAESSPMQLLLKQLKLQNVNVDYSNTAVPRQARGLDYNNLSISDMQMDMRDFEMLGSNFEGDIRQLSMQEQSGLQVKQLTTQFLYAENTAQLRNLLLETNQSVIRDNVQLVYDSQSALANNPGHAQIDVNLRNSRLSFRDLLILVPDLAQQDVFRKYPNSVLEIDTRITGLVDDLHIARLDMSGLGDLRVNARGNVRNATNPDNLYFDLNVGNLSASAATVHNLLPPGSIPDNIALPRTFAARGIARGYADNLYTDLHLNSSSGDASIAGTIDLRNTGAENYDLDIATRNLNLAHILRNNDLGTVSAKLQVTGTGFDPETANIDFDGVVHQAHYNQYNYQNVRLNGNLSGGMYDIFIDSKDPNALLVMNASGSLSGDSPTVRADGSIIKVDLQKLGFYDEPMIISATLRGEFSNLDPDELNGELYLTDFAYSDTENVYALQDIHLTARNEPGNNLLDLRSQVADISIAGDYRLTEISQSLLQTLNTYYQFTSPQTVEKPIAPNQYFTITGQIKNDDLIRTFVPELTDFETINIDGSYNAGSREIVLQLDMPRIVYGDNTLLGGAVNIGNQSGALLYDVSAQELRNENLALHQIQLKGDVADNIINYELLTHDSAEELQYFVKGQLEQEQNILHISLDPGQLLLNYDEWIVASDNRLSVYPNGIVADNFNLQYQNSFIRLQSQELSPQAPLNIEIRDCQLETITRIVQQDSTLAQGVLQANLIVKDPMGTISFAGDAQIDSLKVYGSDVGNLDLQLTESTTDRINMRATLSGFENDVNVEGYYAVQAGEFDLLARINRLNMESLQGFTFDEVREGEGFINGQLNITGTASSPNIRGLLKFNEVGFFVTQLGSHFRSMNDEINFTAEGIRFDRFSMYDREGNEMWLDGRVITRDYRDFAFDLRLRAEDFKVVDAEQESGSMLYGILSVNTDLIIGGNLDLPRVSGSISVDEPTNFTFVVPQATPSLRARDGVVEFIDQDQIVLNQTLKTDTIDTTSNVRGMDVAVNISIMRDAKMSIVIDQASGDFVELQGEAELTGGMDPSGKTTLTGVYEVSEGAYELNVNFLQRRFDIEPGSTITWNGDPMDADINITAIYRTMAAPIDLLEQQLSGVSGADLNIYKQRIPINTHLQLSGEIMKPEVSFDILLDESNPGVPTEVLDNTRTKLQMIRMEENEMNKQVFALLLLNRFIGENPFQSQSGMSAESVARQSVSRIISEQLNNLAADLIDGVDLNFDLESRDDYSTGQRQDRTDLNIGVSRTMLDDRLKVTIGNTFGIEGEARNNENMANIAGDVTLDYKLSRDGRYILRAYRRNEYQIALQGQVIETGVGFIITLEYDKFREIFQRSKERRKERIESTE
ncbi:MAG: translocation/assembly module TamB domain-containing protein [Weeksellaceae bacterium]|nr:translocation/assembly module TamB domain-containing protein [Weeksellaceae bacterium]